MCMGVLSVCLYTIGMSERPRCSERPEEGIGTYGIEVVDCYETACGSWEWNPGPLEEQVLLTTTEPTFRLQMFFMQLQT